MPAGLKISNAINKIGDELSKQEEVNTSGRLWDIGAHLWNNMNNQFKHTILEDLRMQTREDMRGMMEDN